MRAGFHRTFSIVLNPSAPKDGLPFFMGGLELSQNVKGVNCPAGEEVADLARSHDDIDAHTVAPPNRGIDTSQRRGNGPRFSRRALRQGKVRLFSNCERGGKFRPGCFRSRFCLRFFSSGRNGENVDADLIILQKLLAQVELRSVLIREWDGSICTGELMRMY